MLAPDERAVLREQLRPDPGYELDIAVATTFTLDLTAALVAPLAFAAHHVSTSSDPIAVLEAVRSTSERVTVFAQVGHLRVPNTPSDLMAFLERMVHPVRAPVPGYLFHPKVWVLRYSGPEAPRYRMLCGTRNLTDDVSWDAMVRLDGVSRGGPVAANRPLVDFIGALPDMAVDGIEPERRRSIEQLAEDLRNVQWERPPDVNEIAFHALGLRARRSSPLVAQLQGRRHLIVSPFLDDDGITAATSGSEHVTVASRPASLEQLTPSTLSGIDTFVLSPLAGLAETGEKEMVEDEDGPEPGATSLLGGLHAKVYVVEWDRRSWVFIGSANATHAGLFERNVEFVVELQGGRKALGIDRFLGDDAPFRSILNRYEATGGQEPSPEEDLRRQLDRVLRRLADQRFAATVTEEDDGWREAVVGPKPLDLDQDMHLRIGLLPVPGRAVVQEGTHPEAAFTGLPTADVSPFLVLRLSAQLGSEVLEQSTVVRALLLGDPPGRLDEVLARQVNTPEKFLRFLALLLGLLDGPPLPVRNETGDGTSWSFSRMFGQGVFEMLVQAVCARPQAIVDLDRLVSRLEETEHGRAILPDGFADLWSTVLAAHAQIEAGR
jgi:hypothetical protein